MTGRDRIVLIGIVLVVILAGAWMKVVSPERQKASKLSAEVAGAKALLATAEGKLASARAAQSQYGPAYAAMVNLGKAVPPSQEVASLIYQLAHLSNEKNVDFTSIGSGSGGTGSAGSAAPSSASASSASASGTAASASGTSASSSGAALTQLPFKFTFEGHFFNLEHLLSQLTGFTTRGAAGTLQVSGRLLTIQSVQLTADDSSGSEKGGTGWLTGTVSAIAYTAAAPSAGALGASSSAATGAGTSAAPTTSASSPATAPAVVRVNP